jgi:hypothetical protein
MKGLLDSLKKHYWPRYNWKLAIRQPARVPLQPVHSYSSGQKGKKKKWFWKSQKKRTEAAKARGIRTDQAISQTVIWYNEFQLPPDFFLYARIRNQHITATTHESMHDYCSKLSLSCRQFWMAMIRLKLKPLTTQEPVSFPAAKRFTFADVIAEDEHHAHFVLEIKDGYNADYYFRSTAHPMNHPFSSRTDCVASQNQVQLQFTKLFYKMSNPTRTVGGGYIIRVHPGGYDVMIQEQWILQIPEKTLLRQFQLLCNQEATTCS